MSKKPDNIVYSEEEGYNAKLLPYGSNIGAPFIAIEDVTNWKVNGIHRVNKELESKFNDLKNEYSKLLDEFKWNELIYNAKFSFEPVIGEIYHVYRDMNGGEFLSLIAPDQWKQDYVGTTRLNADRKWVKIDLKFDDK